MQVSRNILMPFYRGVVLSAAISVLLPLTSAHAALGGTMAATPAGETGAPPVPILNGAVERLTTVDAGGTTINEYASSTGQIFAYTWQGPTMPDLPELLGAYDASYLTGEAAALATERDLHDARVVQPDVIVESGGQMRSYVGRAWLPDALPAGVTPDDLP
jgi:Protein of unknown function (DUF2844)